MEVVNFLNNIKQEKIKQNSLEVQITNDDMEVEKGKGQKMGENVNEAEKGSCLIMVQQTRKRDS